MASNGFYQALLERISGKGKKRPLETLVAFLRDLGCVGDVLGRDYEILDSSGKLLYTIRQKPMTLVQYQTLMQGWEKLKKLESKKKGRRG